MSDWQVGDLAVFDGDAESCGGAHLSVHKVGAVRYRRVLGFRRGPFRGCKAPYALILEGHSSGGLGSCPAKWRKVSPDEREECEPEFVTLLKRSSRQLTSISTEREGRVSNKPRPVSK